MLKSMLFGAGKLDQGDPWVAILGGSLRDIGYSVAVAPDGSVYVCGDTFFINTQNPNLLLTKFSASGAVQWKKTLGGSSLDYGMSVAIAPDGSVYVCGYTNSVGAGDFDLLLAKFSASGAVQWKKTLGGSSSDYGISVAIAPDGSVYVCGYTASVGAGNSDLLLAKFSASGAVQWKKTLGGSRADYGMSVAIAPDGSVYVCGYTDSVGAGNSDLLLAKFNESGGAQWIKTLGGSSSDYGKSVAVAPDGSVYVCGYTKSVDAGGYGLLLAKFNESGGAQWIKTLGGSSSDYGNSVAIAPDGSVYVCGYTDSVGAGNSDLLLAKITDSLIEKSTATFGDFTFKNAALTLKNASLTSTSPELSDSEADLKVNNASLTLKNASLTATLYPESE